jgi:hypothetical protein
MKTSSLSTGFWAVFLVIVATHILHAQSSYTVTERGADYRVLQKTVVEHGTNRVHKYTELTTGLNFKNNYGQWTEAKEQITILPTGGAAATQGRHKVYFPADIYNGVLEVVTPDGRHLKIRPLCVSYDDGSNTVFIATLKHAVGYLTSSNTVTYRDAFTGFKADLVCTYRRGGFECDLVIRQQIPTPGDYGLDPDWSTLQMVTEFFNTQDPEQIPAASDDWFGLQDSTLKFGKLTMTHGKAFAFKGTNVTSQMPDARSQKPVYKSWVHAEGRTFLIESVPVLDIADDLDALPLTARASSQTPGAKSRTLFASGKRQFPPAHEVLACTNQILLASVDFAREPGVVLDYTTTLDADQTDFTFESGMTYLITGSFLLSGTTVFEGGTVLKYDSANYASLVVDGPWVWPDAQSAPAILTSMDDNSVGETISDCTRSPSAGGDYLFVPFGCGVSNARIFYAGTGLYCGGECHVHDVQFVNCYDAVFSMAAKFDNVLLSGCGLGWLDDGSDGSDEPGLAGCQITADDCGVVALSHWDWQPRDVCLTNCLFTGVGAITDGDNLTVITNQVAVLSGATGIYQTAANAQHYLATTSSYRNAGTTAIDAGLLAELHTLTTYAPHDGGFADTNTPDLGYHYPVNEDSDHDGLPDAWEWKCFGNYSHTGTDLDVNGLTLLYEYRNGIVPGAIFDPPDKSGTLIFTNGPTIHIFEPKAGSIIP